MDHPENLKYSRRHLWCREESDGTLTLGVTAFFLERIDGLVAITLADPGDDILSDVPLGEFEANAGIHPVHSPVDGEAVKRNDRVTVNPDLVVESPYDKGWLVRMRPTETLPEGILLTAEEYSYHLRLQ